MRPELFINHGFSVSELNNRLVISHLKQVQTVRHFNFQFKASCWVRICVFAWFSFVCCFVFEKEVNYLDDLGDGEIKTPVSPCLLPLCTQTGRSMKNLCFILKRLGDFLNFSSYSIADLRSSILSRAGTQERKTYWEPSVYKVPDSYRVPILWIHNAALKMTLALRGLISFVKVT